MENVDEVSKEVDSILANAKVDLDCFEYDKNRVEYAKTVSELYKARVEQMKVEQADRHDNLQLEIEKKKIKNERIVTIIESGLKFVGTGLEVGVPAFLLAVEYEKGLDFEKEGVYTSSTFKNLQKFFRPTKR